MSIVFSGTSYNVYASNNSNVPTLDELDRITEENNVTNTQGNQSNSNSDNGYDADEVEQKKNSFIGSLKNATDMSEGNAIADKFGSTISKYVSIFVQVACYVITAGIVIRIILDIAYITIPFLQNTLANGYTGNPNAGGTAQEGANNGYNNGFGGSGFNTGFGGSSNSFGGSGFNSHFNHANNQANQQQPRGRLKLVSNAALNAVASESTVGPDGRTHSAFKIYAKDMIVVLVIPPIMITLAVTGQLANLGFMIGELIANVVGNINL